MSNHHDNFSDLMSEESFEVVMRGYSRRQVHEHINRLRNQIRDLEERLARTIEQAEQSRIELAEARRRLSEAPQDYDELGQRLSAILKLGEEEAAAKRQTAEQEANEVRERASAEAERLLTTSQEQAQAMMSAAQSEAERRVTEATDAAERMLAQAGADAEETLATARAEAEETRREAHAEAEHVLADAQARANATVNAANAQAESTVREAAARAENMITSAQRRAAMLDEHTGRRVSYLTDTHTEVMRRLNEIGTVLTDLLHKERIAGPLIDEASVLPPAPRIDTDVESDALPQGGGHDEEGRYGEAHGYDDGYAEPARDDDRRDGADDEPGTATTAEHDPNAHDHTDPGDSAGRDENEGHGEDGDFRGHQDHADQTGHAGHEGQAGSADQDDRPDHQADELSGHDLFRSRTPARPDDHETQARA